MRLPWGGVVLADPGFLIAELIEPAQHLQVPLLSLLQSALRRMRGHREVSDFHGRFPLAFVAAHLWRCAHHHARRSTTNRVSIAARGPRSLALRLMATIIGCMIGEIVASDKCARLRCCPRRERARACADLTTRLLYLAPLAGRDELRSRWEPG